MKLSHIVPSLEEQHGGPSKSVRALCAALARGGNDVQLFTTHPAAPESGESHAEGSMQVRVYRRNWPQCLCVAHGLRRALQAGDVDVMHHHSLWLRTLYYAQRRTRGRETRFVVSPRGMMSSWAWRHHRWRKRLAQTFVHPGAFEAVDGWHATSSEEELEIRALGYNQPICVAPNGVVAPTDAEREIALAHWRAAFPAMAGRRIALFYSRFHQKKRVLELIDLWLKTAPADWLLLLVGIPQDYTPDQLERYAQKISGDRRVVAFSGASRPPPYAIASLFLLPSHNENFGLVIAEAMANGVPVVVTDTTPWSMVNAAGVGWCVDWTDYPRALAEATSEQPEQLAQRGHAAQEWVVREFSWDHSARLLANFYAGLERNRP